MANEEGSGSLFIVDLGDVKLPPIVKKQVEAQIQAVVLRALAESNVGAQGARKAVSHPSGTSRRGRFSACGLGIPTIPRTLMALGAHP
jgi:hypothetical protein